ncbi:hypothetical protein QO010_000855 [Caulobacter ginsengisoli]|uniref:CBM-cenC domain-containing protein n=1 Tax=Caulobacter ginsengisoli TaxID=400775 RepID=A0ABU0IM53_9CAUL|nr:hypothetical protein [Caulobacter ginsengisoli]MDQ0463107.1 hypothetical protein [Caulobacter ginsengisoli]
MSQRGSKSLWLLAGLAVGALVLAAAILSQIPAALLSRQADGGDSQARDLARLGAERLRAADVRLAEVEGLAKAALNKAPVESRGASLLAQVRFRQGRRNDGDALMRVATQLSHRDDDADRWAYVQALETRRYPEAFTHLDALLRRQTSARKPLVRTIFPYLGDPAALKPLLARLARGPSWRVAFFELLTDEAPDPSAAFPILAALKSSDHPPTRGEQSQLLRRLVAGGRYEQAYLSWTLLMTPEELARQGNLQDGGFDGWTSTPPFGWNFDSEQGGGGAIAKLGAGKGSALHVTYDGGRDQWLVRQLLVLPPGDYRLTGRFRTRAGGRTEWRIVCQGPAPVVTQVPIGDSGDQWRSFSASFTVPAAGCPGQSLVLQGLPARLDVPIEAWFDDIAVVNAHAG